MCVIRMCKKDIFVDFICPIEKFPYTHITLRFILKRIQVLRTKRGCKNDIDNTIIIL